MKRFSAALLALAVLLPMLAACNHTDPNTVTDVPKTDTPAEVKLRPVVTTTVSHVYSGEYHTFPEDFVAQLMYQRIVDGDFYLRGVRKENTGTEVLNHYVYYIVSPEEGFTGYREIPFTIQPTEENERQGNLSAAVSENSLAVLESTVFADPSTGRSTSFGKYRLSAYDNEGKVLFSLDPEPLIQVRENPLTGSDADFQFNPIVTEMHYGANGTLYMVLEYSVLAISPTGEKLYETGEGYYINDSMETADGRILVNYTKLPEATEHWAYMDDSAKGFSAPIIIPDPGLAEYTLLMGGGHDFYFHARDGLYYMDEGDTIPTLLCIWEDSGIKYSAIQFLMILDEENLLIFVMDGVGAKKEYAVLHRKNGGENSARQVITLGDSDGGIDFSQYAAVFNRQSDTYYIEIRDYEKRKEENGPTLEEDIIAGDAPDIVVTSTNTALISSLTEKGVFVDLNPHLDADPTFAADLLPCVREPFETNGKLYQLPGGITLSGMSGKVKHLPTVQEWTLDAFLSLIGSAETSGVTAVADTYRAQMQRLLVDYNLSSFVQYETAACSFDSKLFLTTVEYLKFLPERRMSPEEIRWLRREYRADNILVDPDSLLRSFLDIMELRVQFADEDITYLGIPTPQGGIPLLSAYHLYRITADSPVKEGAWEFIRYILSKELPSMDGSRTSVFATTKSMLRAQAKAESSMYYILSLNQDAYSGYIWNGVNPPKEYDPEKQIGAYVTEDDAQFLIDLLESRTFYTNRSDGTDETILELIAEELGAYYAGNITAEDAAKRIQSRVSLYLAEQS